jgi:hypothetical protein
MTVRLALLAAVVAAACKHQAPLPARPIAALWAIGDGDAVERDSTQAPTTSPLWDGTTIKTFAARNEIVAFQVVVRAGKTGIAALSARLPALDDGAGHGLKYQPPGEPGDFRNVDIRLFSINYMNVTRPTQADFIYNPGGRDAPEDPTGWKPVQLVPENARPGRGGLPVAVKPGETQALWFELTTPRNLPAGIYRGQIALSADGETRNVPLELEVLAFTLPDQPSLTAMVYFESDQPQLYQGKNLDDVYHRFAHRQRIELVHGYTLAEARAALPRFDGSAYTAAQGYRGPGEGVGDRVLPASFYGPGDDFTGRARAWPNADAWMGFVAQVPRALTFLYLPDEPGEDQFPEIRTLVADLRANPGAGRTLPTFVTHPFAPGLSGAVDIWCAVARHFDDAAIAKERAAGRATWLYNGGRPHAPALVTDAPPSDARVIGWQAFKGDVPGYFYWHAVHWRHNHQKKVGDRNQDVWAEPITFDSRKPNGRGEFANGDGVLIYPGTDVLHPAQDRGIPGPIASMQLANLRRGLQDHMYLTLARKAGHTAAVDAALAAVVPRVFAEASGRVSFPQETAPFEAARLALGRALARTGASTAEQGTGTPGGKL